MLRSLAKDCDFGTTLNDNLRDRLVCGIAETGIQKKLLAEPNLTFEKAFQLTLSHESASKNAMKLIQQPSGVHQIKSTVVSEDPCYRCERKGHSPNDCRFKTATCNYCGKIGHIRPVYRSYKHSNHRSAV